MPESFADKLIDPAERLDPSSHSGAAPHVLNKNSVPALVIGFNHSETQAQQFAFEAALPYLSLEVHSFPDEESKVQLPATLPAQVVFYCSLNRPNDKLIELVLAAAGARAMGARTITLVAPYLCYMRQDKAFHCGEVVSQQVIGRLLAGYFDNLITVDAHLHRVHHLADAVPVSQAVNITATDPMAHFIQQHVAEPYLLGPDSESEQWVAKIATHYQMDYAVALKQRYGDREVEVSLPDDHYQGRNMVLVDDIASTGKTLLQAARALAKYQPASISILVTHALFVDNAMARLREAGISNIWSCDSIVHSTNAVKLSKLLAVTYRGLAEN